MNFGRTLALLFLYLLAITPVRADNYGRISGTILDSSLASVPDALISIVNEDNGLRRTATSRPDGAYSIGSLEYGSYKITVRKLGFRTMIRFGVKLAAQQTVRVDFKLIIGSVQETITVEGSAPLFNTEDASVSTTVGRDEAEHLPIDGQGLLGLIGLTPGAVVTPATRGESGQFTVDGQRPNTHYFTVDGMSANTGVSGGALPAQSTGGSLPALTAFGSLDSLLTPDALQEMRVQTSSSAPQFGRMPGAQVSLTSRSGSNQFHGSALYGFRNDYLDANDWFSNLRGDPRAPLRLSDFSGGLGGPIWRDHTFFFVSYEGMRLDQPFIWEQPVPSLTSRTTSVGWSNPLLSLYPAPNGPDLGGGLTLWTGNASLPSRFDSGAVRLDHSFTRWLTGFFRYSRTPSSTEFGATPLNTLDINFQSITAGFDLRAKPNLFVDFRLNSSDSSAHSAWSGNTATPDGSCYFLPSQAKFPGICDDFVRFTLAGIGQVVVGSEGIRQQSQFQLAGAADWTIRRHTLQFGGDYRRLAPTRTDAAPSLFIAADSISDLSPSISSYWSATSQPIYAAAILREASLFIDDTWRISPRLTFTYGVRWEISPTPTPGLGASVNFYDPTTQNVIASNQPLWQSEYSNFAPRFGVAIQPESHTVVRAGFGVYYDSSLSVASDLVNNSPLSVSGFSGGRGLYRASFFFGFLSGLRLPLIKQWNVSVEHAFSNHDVLSVGYIGSSGIDLIRREVNGLGTNSNPLLGLTSDDGLSSFHSLQAQYRRRVSHGLQALVSYSWAHSIDNSSTDSGLYAVGPNFNIAQDRASSDFDARQSFSAGVTYAIPHPGRNFALRDWELSGNFHSRTGFPINVLNTDQFQGINYENFPRPSLIGGQPVWISDPNAPGGRTINPAAFKAAPLDPYGNPSQGNLGRNALTGFGMNQLDLSVQRDFVIREQRSLQLRMEAYNALNHPNFADPISVLASPLFGQSTSMLNFMLGTGSPASGLAPIFQAGGARSLRLVLRFRF